MLVRIKKKFSRILLVIKKRNALGIFDTEDLTDLGTPGFSLQNVFILLLKVCDLSSCEHINMLLVLINERP